MAGSYGRCILSSSTKIATIHYMDHIQKNILRTVDIRKNKEIILTPTKNKRIKMPYDCLITF